LQWLHKLLGLQWLHKLLGLQWLHKLLGLLGITQWYLPVVPALARTLVGYGLPGQLLQRQ